MPADPCTSMPLRAGACIPLIADGRIRRLSARSGHQRKQIGPQLRGPHCEPMTVRTCGVGALARVQTGQSEKYERGRLRHWLNSRNVHWPYISVRSKDTSNED